MDGQPLLRSVVRRPLRYRPGPEHAFHLETEIEVEPAGGVLMHHKEPPTAIASERARRFRRPLEASAWRGRRRGGRGQGCLSGHRGLVRGWFSAWCYRQFTTETQRHGGLLGVEQHTHKAPPVFSVSSVSLW